MGKKINNKAPVKKAATKKASTKKPASSAASATKTKVITRTNTVTKYRTRPGERGFALTPNLSFRNAWTIAKGAGLASLGVSGTQYISGFIPFPKSTDFEDSAAWEKAVQRRRWIILGAKAGIALTVGIGAAFVSPALAIFLGAGAMVPVLMDGINIVRDWFANRAKSRRVVNQATGSQLQALPEDIDDGLEGVDPNEVALGVASLDEGDDEGLEGIDANEIALGVSGFDDDEND